MAYLPRAMVSPVRWRKLKEKLTYKKYNKHVVASYKNFNKIGKANLETVTACAVRFDAAKQAYAIPRSWAQGKLPVSFENKTTSPVFEKRRLPKPPTPRDEKQKEFFSALLAKSRKPGPVQLLANATTGSGKTVCALYLGVMLATPTLIVVDSNKIADGFRKNLVKFFGDAWVKQNVGHVQQDTCIYRNKLFVITLVQSLMSRKYPESFYRHFGLVCYDEVQVFGSENYHKALGMFSARVLIGFTATNKEGSFGRIVTDYLGEPAVVSKQAVMKPQIKIVDYELKDQDIPNAYSDYVLITSLSENSHRNQLIAKIAHDGFLRKRRCLIMSERIKQLQDIKSVLIGLFEVPESEIGLHVGEYEDGTYTVGYSYCGSRWIRLKASTDVETAAKWATKLTSGHFVKGLHLPEALKNCIKQREQVFFTAQKNTIKPTQKQLDTMANSCHILLATYQIFGKGVDYPMLDMGIEATPVGNVTQPLGRILRLPDGFSKPTPEWYSINDKAVLSDRMSSKEYHNACAANTFFDTKAHRRELGYMKARADVIRGYNPYRKFKSS
jgi:superfamily II DNA or RNA helicase